MIKIRDRVALNVSYIMFRYVASKPLQDRTEQALKTGLKAQGLKDLRGTPARRRTIVNLPDVPASSTV